ncbi:MAG: hypothetical protein ACYC27_01860 [Armatimonadota bacterium]
MGAVTIEEDIRVGVAFDKRKIMPLWFKWRDRYYKVSAVNFTWSTNTGAAKLRHYSVTDGINTYELCFNSRTLEWMLGRVFSE